MKLPSILLAALLLPATAALAQAQTVLPSGAVAPASPTTPLGTSATPGIQPTVTPDMRDAGPRRAKRRDALAPGMTRQDRKRLRKMSNPRELPAGSGQ